MDNTPRPLAVVTGASSGIGYHLADCAAGHGYDLILAADTPLAQAVRDFEARGAKVEAVHVDLSTLAGVDQLLGTIGERQVGVLVANAGHGLGGPFLEQDFKDILHVINTNITGTVYLVHQVARRMRERAHGQGFGRILITGSVAGLQPGAFEAVYAATKAFIDSFALAIRNELKDSAVTVTCLMPGPTETEFFERAGMLDTKVGRSHAQGRSGCRRRLVQQDAGTGLQSVTRGSGRRTARPAGRARLRPKTRLSSNPQVPDSMPVTTTIDVWYFNAGGGHRAAAAALDQVIRRQRPHWQVRAFNIMEVLDPQGWYKRVTGTQPEDYYNMRLRTGFTLGLAQELKMFQATVRVCHPVLVKVLQQHYLRTEPDVVVSVIPNLNRPMCEALATTLPGVPYVTIMTDIADFPPDFWVLPDESQHVVCGSDRAMLQARELGCHESRLHRMSGMILRPDFYEPLHVDRARERRALGLDPGRPTGVVLFGGHGSRVMTAIAQELDDVQLILMCGHNASLARRLRSLNASAPRAIVEFTPAVRRYMQLADFFIGKPGPGSLSEAVHVGLPIVTVRNAWTMPQERYNTHWVRENGLGIVGTSMRDIGAPVRELLRRLPEFTANVARMPSNRAVFEVPEILERILAGAPGPLQEVTSLGATTASSESQGNASTV